MKPVLWQWFLFTKVSKGKETKKTLKEKKRTFFGMTSLASFDDDISTVHPQPLRVSGSDLCASAPINTKASRKSAPFLFCNLRPAHYWLTWLAKKDVGGFFWAGCLELTHFAQRRKHGNSPCTKLGKQFSVNNSKPNFLFLEADALKFCSSREVRVSPRVCLREDIHLSSVGTKTADKKSGNRNRVGHCFPIWPEQDGYYSAVELSPFRKHLECRQHGGPCMETRRRQINSGTAGPLRPPGSIGVK